MKSKRTIYIADDDEDDRMLLREAISKVIQEVVIKEVWDGVELIDQIKTDALTGDIVILLDMNMPKMNGLEALAILRSDPALSHIPVIMISTASNPQLITKAYAQGINAYVAKPYRLSDYEELAKAVNICFLNNYPQFEEPVAIKNIHSKNILVIEDNDDQRKLIDLALKYSLPEVNVIHLKDQVTSVDFINMEWQKFMATPDLILLDLYLPDRTNGLALLGQIKKFLLSKNLTTIPIIVLSHSNHPDDIRECYRSNANAFMSKSSDLTKWFSFFSYLCHFWMDTIITSK